MLEIVRNFVGKIREINRTYSHPKIHQSRGVKASLILLRIYLLVLVVLLVYKFVAVIYGG